MMDNITRNQWTDINLHRIDTILTITTTTKQGKIRQGKASMSSCIHPPWIWHTYFELEAIFNLISTPSSWNSIIYYVTKKTPCCTTTTTTTTFLHFQLFNHRLSIYYHGQPWPRYSNVPYLSLAEYFTLHTSHFTCITPPRHTLTREEKKKKGLKPLHHNQTSSLHPHATYSTNQRKKKQNCDQLVVHSLLRLCFRFPFLLPCSHKYSNNDDPVARVKRGVLHTYMHACTLVVSPTSKYRLQYSRAFPKLVT